MHTFVESPVSAAHDLLADYFDYRQRTFPQAGGYVTTLPGANDFTSPHGQFVIVELEGTPVGCGGVRRLDDRRFEVKHLWLRPEVQGRGLGRSLLAELERRAIALGATEIVLDTNSSLAAAGTLYRSNGYTEIEPYNANPNATHWFGKSVAS